MLEFISPDFLFKSCFFLNPVQGCWPTWRSTVTEIGSNQAHKADNSTCRLIATQPSKSTKETGKNYLWKQIWKTIAYIQFALARFFFLLSKLGKNLVCMVYLKKQILLHVNIYMYFYQKLHYVGCFPKQINKS